MGASVPPLGPDAGPGCRAPSKPSADRAAVTGYASGAVSQFRPEPTGLAEAFAQEPELVLACLNGAGAQSVSVAQHILRAAQLALAARPQYADLHCYAAHAALAAGAPQVARKLLAAALTINPEYADARVLAGHVALLCGQGREAREHLERALAGGADFPDVHMLLGRVWELEQDWARAGAAYQRALALNENMTAAREALAALPVMPPDGKSHELPA